MLLLLLLVACPIITATLLVESRDFALEGLLLISMILTLSAFASVSLIQLFVSYELLVFFLMILIYLTVVSLYRVRTSFYLFIVGRYLAV